MQVRCSFSIYLPHSFFHFSDAGTVTGSIMDFNEATSDEENTSHNRGLLSYAEHNNNNTMGLSHHDSDPHNLRSAGKSIIAAFVYFVCCHISINTKLRLDLLHFLPSYILHLLCLISALVTHPITFSSILYTHADTHYPTSTTHTHTSHPSHPLQLQDSYGTAVRSATKLLADEVTTTTTGEGQEEGWVQLLCCLYLLCVFVICICCLYQLCVFFLFVIVICNCCVYCVYYLWCLYLLFVHVLYLLFVFVLVAENR